MFILIYKIFTFDFYHASEIAFFGNTAQKKRTIGDLHVSMRSRYIATLRRVAHKTKGWHAKRWVGTQNDRVAHKTKGGTQNEGWHAKRRVAHKTMGSTQNDGVGN